MKKHFLIYFFSIFISFSAFSQSNIGFIAGSGISHAGYKFVSLFAESNAFMPIGIGPSQTIYHFGVNFENVIKERMLYLQFGLQAMNKGFKLSDDYFVNAHGIHIPLEMKYKYFFNRRGEEYISANLGVFASAYYRGLEYDKYEIDAFLADTTGTLEMEDPRIKFGKLVVDEQAEMSTFDYGISAGFGVGLFGHLQINYNFGLSIAPYMYDAWDFDLDTQDDTFLFYKNRFHTITLGFFFTNK